MPTRLVSNIFFKIGSLCDSLRGPLSQVVLLVLVSAAFLTPAQIFAKDRPDWIDGKSVGKWDHSQYLTAVGSGKSLEDASAAAKRGVAEVIRATVQGQFSRKSESSLSESASGKTEGVDVSQTSSSLDIKVDVQLRGVEIAQSYQDKDEKTYYALAVLDRAKIKNIYSQEGNRVRAAIMARKKQFDAHGRHSDGEEILTLMDSFASLNSEYAVFSNGAFMPDPLSAEMLEMIKSKMREASRSNLMFLDVESDMPGVKEALGACLSEKGHKVVDEASPDVGFVVSAKLADQQQEMKVEGFVKYEFSLKGSVLSGGKSIGVWNTASTGTGRNEKQSFDQVKQEMFKVFCSKMLKVVNSK